MVHLKEFSLLSPNIQSSETFTEIETAIPAEAIEEVIAKTKVEDERNRSEPSTSGSLFDNSNELVVTRLNARCTKEFDCWAF